MKRTWLYFVNTFDVNTQKSFGKMLQIANDHDSRLAAAVLNVIIKAIYDVFNPAAVEYRKRFSVWRSSGDLKKGKTMSFVKQLKALSDERIRAWEGKVFYHYPEGSIEAMTIFPNKRAPFQSENYEERIQAVQTLVNVLETYPLLESLVKEVEDTYTALIVARDAQKQAMEVMDANTDALEEQRRLVAKLLYEDLATIMKLYSHEPTLGERFFDLSLLRRPSTDADTQFTYTVTVDAGNTVVVPVPTKLVLGTNSVVSLANASNSAELQCFFAASASATDSPNKAVAQPNEAISTTAAEIGWGSGNAILIVKNAGTVTAEFELGIAEI